MKKLRALLADCARKDFERYLASERAAEDYCNEVVDGEGQLLYLDSLVSVSASETRRGTLCLLR